LPDLATLDLRALLLTLLGASLLLVVRLGLPVTLAVKANAGLLAALVVG